MWIYSLPDWISGLLIVGATVSVALVVHRLWLRLFPGDHPEERRGLALEVMEISALILSLLLAFTSVAVWEAYRKAADAVEEEASLAGELARDLALFGSSEATDARAALGAYVRSAIDDEWPAMAEGRSAEVTARRFDAVFRGVGRIEAHTSREEVILHEIWIRVNDLNRYREGRLHSLDSAIPGPLWGVVIAGTLVTFLLFYVQPVHRFNTAMLAAYSAVMGMVFFFIVAMDHPFAGRVSVSAEPFEEALVSMERWDAETPTAPASPDTGSHSTR